jgi:hypothetical protein
MKHHTPTPSETDDFGARLVARLDLAALPDETTQRLRAAREQALGHYRLAALRPARRWVAAFAQEGLQNRLCAWHLGAWRSAAFALLSIVHAMGCKTRLAAQPRPKRATPQQVLQTFPKGMSEAAANWCGRISGVVALLILCVGLVGIPLVQNQTRVLELAEIDAALLTDDLPPAAYADAGFAQFIKVHAWDAP